MSSILFINRVYPPAEGATGQLLAELAEALAQRGHSVTVVASQAGMNGPTPRSGGVRIERVGGLPFTRASHFRRALSYLSLYPAMLWRALRLPRHDVVITLTDPPLLLLLGPLLKWSKGSKLIHWAQDLYPELAEEMAILEKDGLIARTLRGLSTWALRRGERIVAVGQCMKTRLRQRGLPPQSVAVIPNWGNLGNGECRVTNVESADRRTGNDECRIATGEFAQPTPEARSSKRFQQEHGVDDHFVVMYSGNLGLAHPFEAILDAAERLQLTLPHVVILFVGAGPRLAWVQEQVERRRLENVRFLLFQPKERLAESLAAADLHLASMRQELCGLVVPSKVYGVLAAGRPCVFLGPKESEAAQTILQHGCGSVLSNATGARLAACIGQWAKSPRLLQEARQRAMAISGEVGLVSAVNLFEALLKKVVESGAMETVTLTDHWAAPKA
jgi:colanic acid biosynthesis glycosyl transferase WcaI